MHVYVNKLVLAQRNTLHLRNAQDFKTNIRKNKL